MSRWRCPASILVLSALTGGSAAAQDRVTPAMRAEMESLVGAALTSSRAPEILRGLTDSVGPRLAGSAGDRAAVAWGVATLRALGFSNVRAEKVLVPVWRRISESASMTAPVRQLFAVAALGGSVSTPDEGITAEVVEADSLAAVDALGERARGKIVFIWKKTERRRDGGGYGETVPIRHGGAARAAKFGALAVLIRSVGTDDNRLPHTGAMDYDAKTPKIPAAALSTPDADLLHRALAEGRPVTVTLKIKTETGPDAESANVIGEIPGREKPDEIVLVGGHLDSWDLGTGAVDDGAGCSISIEAARLIGALPQRPRRTIRVVLFANEENGLRGGRGYAVDHASELSKHVAAIEADAGGDRATGYSWNAAPAAGAFMKEMEAFLAGIGADRFVKGGSGGADISPLLASGIPLLGLRNDSSRYFDVHHTANDTYDKVDPVQLNQATAAMVAMTYALAEAAEPLPRIPESDRTRRRPE
ncbi:MAG TPA: M28 family peptidase [Thermoanaerobaculia bacterium]|nr:M28 family peptidase [Thermoanaerobaculia bacterium]